MEILALSTELGSRNRVAAEQIRQMILTMAIGE
jgi:hypothetical protein